ELATGNFEKSNVRNRTSDLDLKPAQSVFARFYTERVVVEHGLCHKERRIVEEYVRWSVVVRLGARQLVETNNPELGILKSAAPPATVPSHRQQDDTLCLVTRCDSIPRNALRHRRLRGDVRSIRQAN